MGSRADFNLRPSLKCDWHRLAFFCTTFCS